MLVVLFCEPEDGIGQREPEHARDEQCHLVPIPRPVRLVAVEVQKGSAVGNAVGDVAGSVGEIVSTTKKKVQRIL